MGGVRVSYIDGTKLPALASFELADAEVFDAGSLIPWSELGEVTFKGVSDVTILAQLSAQIHLNRIILDEVVNGR